MLCMKHEIHCTQICRSRKVQLTVAHPTVASGKLIVHPVPPVITLCNSDPSRRHGTRRASTTRALPADCGVDVVGFGNLCVDAVLPLEQLPPADVHVRRQLLDTLTSSPPDKSSWEVGGNCNFMVAAARLGLRVASVGHIGTDVYGEFMDEVLRSEGIQATTRIAQSPPLLSPSPRHQEQQHQPQHPQQPTELRSTHTTTDRNSSSSSSRSRSSTASASSCGGSISGATPHMDSTLICFVLVDPASRHAFCSRYDFGPWPLLEGIRTLPREATVVLRTARAVFTNGFIFDELPLAAVKTACSDAIEHGAAIFFDPGPRCQTMLEGPRRAALDLLLDLSSVVLMTEEEARVVTGLDDPQAAAEWILARPGARAQWVVVKMGGQGALLCERNTSNSNSRSDCSSSSNSNGSSGGGASNGHRTYPGSGCGCNGAASSAEATARVTRLGAVKVDVVDTVGCGDSFAAAVVLGYISGWPADVTVALANAVGGATATGRGAGRNVARLERVLALLAEGAAGAAGTAGCGPEAAERQRDVFARACELLLQSLARDGRCRDMSTRVGTGSSAAAA